MITNDRLKQLMAQVGMPNSISLYQALLQCDKEARISEREATKGHTAALRAVVSHWREFGPEYGFDETLEMAARSLVEPAMKIDVPDGAAMAGSTATEGR